ncbi:MAG: sigma-54 dependent transcriptional regulator [Candidatus Eisenbacteria bacterium]
MTTATRNDVLIVDDHDNQRQQLRGVLEDEGFRVTDAGDAEHGLAAIAEQRFDAVVLDVNMPGMDGLTALGRMSAADPDLAVVIVTGESLIQRGREAVLKLGAFDVLAKMPEPEDLVGVVRQAVELTRSRRARLEKPARGNDLGLLGESAAIRTLVETVRKVAPSQGRVLVHGENGSGKELVAAAIHALSKRADKPFVAINCAAIPKDLVESELFGYEKGAFTGAMQSKKGRFEQADGGTLFLDEIGELSAEAQSKLLRAIETGEIERVGSTRPVTCDVRVVSATNRDLGGAMEAGEFRQDLYFRLNVLPVQVPALRERGSDIALLATHFLTAICAGEDKPAKTLTPEALELLEGYSWPGNVRELRNLMERAAVMVDAERVGSEDLVIWLEAPRGGDDAVGLRGEIERREADAVRKALESAGWNVTQAAAGLGIDRTNLHRKMRKYGIQRH